MYFLGNLIHSGNLLLPHFKKNKEHMYKYYKRLAMKSQKGLEVYLTKVNNFRHLEYK